MKAMAAIAFSPPERRLNRVSFFPGGGAPAPATVQRDAREAVRSAEIDQEVNRAREALRGKVVSIALAGAGKVLEREVDESAHGELLNKLAAEI